MNTIEKPISVLKTENRLMAKMIISHFMEVLRCKDVKELVETCETIIDAAKSTNYYLAE